MRCDVSINLGKKQFWKSDIKFLGRAKIPFNGLFYNSPYSVRKFWIEFVFGKSFDYRQLVTILDKALYMKIYRFTHAIKSLIKSISSRKTAWKIWNGHAKVAAVIGVQNNRKSHFLNPFKSRPVPIRATSSYFNPACFLMLPKVPIGMSLEGCFTVTRPGLSLCLNWWCEPLIRLKYHPSLRSIRMISLLSMRSLNKLG